MTITHACGHKRRVALSGGTATTKSAQAHTLTMQDCPKCAAADVRWTDAARRQADFCRRKHLDAAYWERLGAGAEALTDRVVTVAIVQEACRSLQNEAAQVAAVSAEYEREQARLAARRYVVTLHYDEYPTLDSLVVWEGAGFWVAARWAQSAAKSLIATNAHAYVEHNAENTIFSAYRRDWTYAKSYILVGHASMTEAELTSEPITGNAPTMTH